MITYRQATVGGAQVFYRQDGPQTAPTLLLLHGRKLGARAGD
ncbi:MAG TPA: hypothetical protein VGQ83_09840 [Polyangia bacterium]|jgi:pimeloyl-ACP methyl ester carboxylesterase